MICLRPSLSMSLSLFIVTPFPTAILVFSKGVTCNTKFSNRLARTAVLKGGRRGWGLCMGRAGLFWPRATNYTIALWFVDHLDNEGIGPSIAVANESSWLWFEW
eukprot:SAG31_NODE_3057_length_4736_cov_28.760190_1_plen_104_part_00